MIEHQKANELGFTFEAFISYRHTEPDMRVALMLHRLLEGYRIPKGISKHIGKKRIGRIFRDRDELPLSGDLSADIQKALENSRFLIVVCSPRTPESTWCCKEIEEFKRLHGDGSILSILIEGEPNESFPDALRFCERPVQHPDGSIVMKRFEVEPLAADARGMNLREMYKKLKEERLRLLAPMIGVRYDDLKQRHREQFLKKAATITLAITLSLASFGFISLMQSNIIARQSEEILSKNVQLEEQIDETEKQRDQALVNESLILAEKSTELSGESNNLEAIRAALDALPKNVASPERPYVKEVEWALLKAVLNNGMYKQWTTLKEHNGYVNIAKFSHGGKLILTVSSDNIIRVWETCSGRKVQELNMHFGGSGEVSTADFSKDDRYILSSSGWDNIVYLWDVSTGDIKADLSNNELQYSNETFCTGFSSDSSSVFTLLVDGVHIFDAETGKETCFVSPDGTGAIKQQDMRVSAGFVTYNHSGDRLAILSQLSTTRGFIADPVTGKQLVEFDDNYRYVSHSEGILQFSPDDRYILVGTESAEPAKSGAVLIDANNGETVFAFGNKESSYFNPIRASFSYDSNFLAIGFNEECVVYSLDTMKVVFRTPLRGPVKFHPQKSNILVNGEEIFDISAAKKIAALEESGSTMLDLSFCADGKYIVAGCLDSTARIWNFDSGIGMERVNSYDETIKSVGMSVFPLKRNVTFVQGYSIDESIYGNPSHLRASSMDGRYWAYSYPDGAIELYDLDMTTETEVNSFAILKSLRSWLPALEFQPLKDQLMAASVDGAIIVYDLKSQRVIHSFKTGVNASLQYAVFSPDGKWLMALDSNRKLYLWLAENYDKLLELDIDEEKDVASIGFTMDSSYAVVLYDDNTADKLKLYADSNELLEYATQLISQES